jgi:hypothetical protein
MFHRRASALALLVVPAMMTLAFGAAAPVTAAPAALHDVLSGRWLVSHTCLTLCKGSQHFSEVIRHRAGDVYVGTGGEAETLYQMGSQVLVHAPDNSVVLSIRQPRRFMTGQGITSSGATFSVTWRCVARGAQPKATTSAPAMGRSDAAPQASEIC